MGCPPVDISQCRHPLTRSSPPGAPETPPRSSSLCEGGHPGGIGVPAQVWHTVGALYKSAEKKVSIFEADSSCKLSFPTPTPVISCQASDNPTNMLAVSVSLAPT